MADEELTMGEDGKATVDMSIAVLHNHEENRVRVIFGYPIKWIELTPEAATQLGQTLLTAVSAIDGAKH